jgi:serine/threonine-protein kinase RsbW
MSSEKISFELKNCLSETGKLCHCIEDIAQSLGLAKKDVFAINLALEELFTNIVSYGYSDADEHRINIYCALEDRALVIRIEDDGDPFNPVEAAPPDFNCPLEESKIGGLGIHLVKKMMDDVTYERMNEKNIIVMKKFFNND